MAFTKKKRKEIEDKVLKTFSILDKTGENLKRYQEFFKGMDDKQFSSWINKFLKDDDFNFVLEVVPFKNEPNLKAIQKAANFLKVPLEEVVTFNHLGGVQTKEKVPVGYILIKRHQQTIIKKNSLAHNIKSRNFKSGLENWPLAA